MKKLAFFCCCILTLFFSTDLFAFSNSKAPVNDSMINVFRTFGGSRYRTTITMNGNDTLALGILNKELATKIAAYLNTKNDEDFSQHIESDPESIILLGFLHIFKEKGYTELTEAEQSRLAPVGLGGDLGGGGGGPDLLGCLIQAASAVVGIANIRTVYASLMAGATSATAFAALKLILKRVAFGVTLVFAIYELGECFGVW